MTSPPALTEFDPHTLLVFVGYCDDDLDAADVIVGLEGHLQRELDKARDFNDAIAYRRVKVWKWANDAAAEVGGQLAVIRPTLDRAEICVFVFARRVGPGTWHELNHVRAGGQRRQLLPFFAATPPPMGPKDAVKLRHWLELIERQRELGGNWFEENSKAVTPLPEFTDLKHLAALALERIERAMFRVLKQAMAVRPSPPPPVERPAPHVPTANQESVAHAAVGALSVWTGRTPPETKPTPPKAVPPSPGPPRPTLVVDRSGVGADYREIADAVAAAKPGTLIRVNPGWYRKPVVIDKDVEVAGDGPREQIVLETVDQNCIHLKAATATVRGLTLRLRDGGKKAHLCAVYITTGRPLLADCDISADLLSGVEVIGDKSVPTIRGCRLANCKQSGLFFCGGAGGLAEDCEVVGNGFGGIAVRDVGTAPTFRRCRAVAGKEGGLFFYDGAGGLAEDCELVGNAESGVELRDFGTAPVVRNCRMNGNKLQGIHAHKRAGGRFEGCDLTGNAGGPWNIEDGCTVTRVNNRE